MTSFFVLPVASHISSSFLIKSRGSLAETTAVSPVYFFEDITSFFSANVNTSFNQALKSNYTRYIVLQKFTKVNIICESVVYSLINILIILDKTI